MSLDESDPQKATCFTTPTVYHAAIVIFLEFFAFGLLTTPMISVLDETFPKHTFLMNGIIQGVKGFLSFLSAPLLGALSDVIGRKPFLLLTVTFTCSPIPLMKISHWWYFTMISISGVFAVTFSVVLAYVADITSEDERSWGYGLVSATFAASLVSSPAIGAYLGRVFSEDLVVALATAIALLDILFIMACVPESLPEKVRASHLGSITGRGGSASGKLSWDKMDPFAALRKVTNDYLVLIVCITTFFSYLPEAGQYSCFFVYLRLVMGFSEENIALFIAVGGILSCLSQTVVLNLLNAYVGPKCAIIIGLSLEAAQLALYGFASQPFLLWTAGLIAAMGTVTYPALSAFVSKHAAADQQGVAQGLITGIRGLCGGLGPALFGLIFYVFQVDLNTQTLNSPGITHSTASAHADVQLQRSLQEHLIPGPPFAFGAILVLLAIFVSWFIPDSPKTAISNIPPDSSPASGPFLVEAYEGHRLRRYSPMFLGTSGSEFGSEFAFSGAVDSSSCLLDSRSHSKDVRMHAKDHLPSYSEPGLWNRLTFGWVDHRRSPSVRYTARVFRQPTVSFTRARFVEPFRRLLSGLSVSTKPGLVDGPRVADIACHPSGFDSRAFSSNDVMRDGQHSLVQTLYDTEAADLSNYRSHTLKHLLSTTAVQHEADVLMAHRFDAYPPRHHIHLKPRTLSSSLEPEECMSLLSTFSVTSDTMPVHASSSSNSPDEPTRVA